MRSLTASDRSTLLKLASSLPKGSEERRAILAGLVEVKTDSPRLLHTAMDNGPADFSAYHATESDFESVRSKVRMAIQETLPHFPPQSTLLSGEWQNIELAHFDNPGMAFSASLKIPAYGKAALILIHVKATPFGDTRKFTSLKYAGWRLVTGLYAIDDYKVWKTLARFLKPEKQGEYKPFAKEDSPAALLSKINALQNALIAAAEAVGK